MAVDVCDLCYGDLCRSCALALKGRKDRVCKDCALTVSGVRGSGKPEIRGDRRTVKSRRKAYAGNEQAGDFFEFFDVGLPADALAADPPPPPASKSDREKAAAGGPEVAADKNDSPAATDGTGIRRLFGRRKPIESEPVDGDLVAIDEVLTDTPGADGQDVGDEKDADAVSQLADIRRRDRAATTATSTSDVVPGNPTEIDRASSNDADGAFPFHDDTEPPSDGPVAIPTTQLQGFPDRSPANSEDPPPSSAPDEAVDPPTSHDATARPRLDPLATLHEDAASATDGGSPPPEPNDELDSSRGLSDTTFGEDRRRPLQPVDEHPIESDDTPSPSVGRLDHLSDVSPRLRDLVSDLSSRPPSASPADNPFLKRSRVVSEPDAVPDFTTDPFSGGERPGSSSPTSDGANRTRVPAPISPSSSPSPHSINPGESPREAAAGPASATSTPEGATLEPDTASPKPETSVAPEHEPAAVSADESLRPTAPGPDPATESTEAPADHEPESPVAETHPSPPTRATFTPAERHPLAAFADSDRHPLAAFADSDRHPLAAFARRTTPTPPTHRTPTEQPPRAFQPPPAAPAEQPSSAEQPPPIDDVFPSDPAALDVHPSIDRPGATGDLPPIDDLLPPEPDEPESPPSDLLPPEPDEPESPLDTESATAPTALWQPWEPTETEPTEPTESTEPSESWQPGEPTETEPTEPTESWEHWEPAEAAPTVVDKPAHGEAHPDTTPSPGSTVLRTVDDEWADWTVVDDVPDLDGSTSKQRADTDARGSWIPPALRGIAPDAKEAAEELPRRRR